MDSFTLSDNNLVGYTDNGKLVNIQLVAKKIKDIYETL